MSPGEIENGSALLTMSPKADAQTAHSNRAFGRWISTKPLLGNLCIPNVLRCMVRGLCKFVRPLSIQYWTSGSDATLFFKLVMSLPARAVRLHLVSSPEMKLRRHHTGQEDVKEGSCMLQA